MAIENVKAEDFGDCRVDLGLAVNAAIEEIKPDGGSIELPKYPTTLLTGINDTNIQVPILFHGYGRAAPISAKTTGHVTDYTGSTFHEFRDILITGNSIAMPQTAFFLARDSDNRGGGRCIFKNIETMGHFSKSVIYGYGAECLRFDAGCFFVNSEPGAKTATFTRNNLMGLTSGYAAIATGAQSNTEIRMIGTTVNNYGGADSIGLYLHGVSGFSWEGGYSSVGGRAPICLDGGGDPDLACLDIGIRNIRTEANPTCKNLIYFKGGEGSVFQTIVLQNISGHTEAFADGGRTIYSEDGSQIIDANIDNIYEAGSQTFDLYSAQASLINSSLYDFYGRYSFPGNIIRVPSSARLHLSRPEFDLTSAFFLADQGIFWKPVAP